MRSCIGSSHHLLQMDRLKITPTSRWFKIAASSSSHLSRPMLASSLSTSISSPLCPSAVTHSSSSLSSSSTATRSLLFTPYRKMSDFSIRDAYSEEQQKLLQRTSTVIDQLHVSLQPLELQVEDKKILDGAAKSLNEMFLMMVCGEFNAGKSQFINTLVGQDYCKVGALPTTSKIVLLKYGESVQHIPDTDIIDTLRVPVAWLKDANVVDTPGTNAVHKHHEQITKHFVPRADMVFFVTSIDRPLSKSEKKFLSLICQWKKKVVMVVNKSDLVPDQHERDQIRAFVQENTQSVLGTSDPPDVFFTSGKQAFEAQQVLANPESSVSEKEDAEELLEESGWPELTEYIQSALTQDVKIALKLSTPLFTAQQVLDKYVNVLRSRETVNHKDQETVRLLDVSMSNFQKDLERDLDAHLASIDNIFYGLSHRTDKFLTEHFQISNVAMLLKKEELRKQFHIQVNGSESTDLEESLDRFSKFLRHRTKRVQDDISRLLKAGQSEAYARLASPSISLLSTDSDSSPSSSSFSDPAVSSSSEVLVMSSEAASDPTGYHASRAVLLRELQTQARELNNEEMQHQRELSLNMEAGRALSLTAAPLVGSLGMLGTCWGAAMLDWTGILASSLLAVGGLVALPYRRRELQTELDKKLDIMREEMKIVVNKHFQEELNYSVAQIASVIDPYRSWTDVHQERNLESRLELNGLLEELNELNTQCHSYAKHETRESQLENQSSREGGAVVEELSDAEDTSDNEAEPTDVKSEMRS